MTEANTNTKPSHNIVARYVEPGSTHSGRIGAMWENDNEELSIVIYELKRRLVLYAFPRREEDRVENGPSHDIKRFYRRGPNAPYANVGCVFSKDDGKYSILLDDFDTQISLSAFPNDWAESTSTGEQTAA